MENRGSEEALRAPGEGSLDEVIERADAPRGDHGHTDGLGDRAGQLEVVALLGAVAIHRGEEQLACPAGAAALRIIDEEGLVENSRIVGAALLDRLMPFIDDYPFVGTVRGRGLLLGMELVRDKKTKEPLARTVTSRLFDECVKRGLLSMVYAPSFRLQPSLTIDRATAENAVVVLREVFDLCKREGFWRDA